MTEFSGRKALVTGSSSGIGEAIARRLAQLGATVVVNSANSIEAGNRVAKEIGGSYVQGDISQAESRERLIKHCASLGGLDILVNNAGWTKLVAHHDLDSLSEETFRKTFEVNVFGTWELTKLAMPLLKAATDPNVINVTSIAGVRPVGSSIAYSMSKAALNHMTLLLAKSHAPVRVNAVAPGLVETPWTESWQDQHAGVRAIAPLQRSATPDDCVETVMGFLRNRYMTGQVVVVDGGLTLKM
ncbi:MAG: hypothetical protein RLZZ254_655 [Actinomycetota bacterium]|jgi:ketoreductase RED2